MVVMKSINAFLVVRYTVFGLFTICNAIICSVAVWNYSLVLYTQPAQVDLYLIILGAFSLLSIITLTFVELMCVNVSTTRVWFECTWVALFWLMELAGGAALIAITSDVTCLGPTATVSNALCTSERVLLAFTWMCTITLLIYLLTVVSIAASHYVENPKVWVSDVRALRAAVVRQPSSSTPDSPLTTRFKKRPSVDKYQPRPSRSQLARAFSRPTSLRANYKIEPFLPIVAPEQMDSLNLSDLPEAIPLPPVTIISSFPRSIPFPKERKDVRPLSLGQFDGRREPTSSVQHPNLRCPGQSISSLLPSPLGDWPRQDVMQLPARPKHNPIPPSAFEFPRQQLTTMTPIDRASLLADTAVQPRPRRPSGPRQRLPSGESGHRPAPLDLYAIGA